MGEAVEERTGQASEPNTLVHSSKGRLLVTMTEPRSVGAEHLEQQLGTGWREGHVAELVDDQQLARSELALQPQQALVRHGLRSARGRGRRPW